MTIPYNRWLTVPLDATSTQYVLGVNNTTTGNKNLYLTNLSNGDVTSIANNMPVTRTSNANNGIIQDTVTGDIYYCDLTNYTAGSQSRSYGFGAAKGTSRPTDLTQTEFNNSFGTARYDVYPIILSDDLSSATLGGRFTVSLTHSDNMFTVNGFDDDGDPLSGTNKLIGHQHKLFATGSNIWADECFTNPNLASATLSDYGSGYPAGFASNAARQARWLGERDIYGSVLTKFTTSGSRLTNTTTGIAVLNNFAHPFGDYILLDQLRFAVRNDLDYYTQNTQHQYTIYTNVIGKYLIRIYQLYSGGSYYIDIHDTGSGFASKTAGVSRYSTVYPYPRESWGIVATLPFNLLANPEYTGLGTLPSIAIDYSRFSPGEASTIELVLTYPNEIIRWSLNNRGSAQPQTSGNVDSNLRTAGFGYGYLAKNSVTQHAGHSAIVAPGDTKRKPLCLRRASNLYRAERDGQIDPMSAVTKEAAYDATFLEVYNPPDELFDVSQQHRFTYNNTTYELNGYDAVGSKLVGNERVLITRWRQV